MQVFRNKPTLLLSLAFAFSMLLTACGTKTPAEPTKDPNAVYTAAAATVQSQLTQQAALNPTATNTLAPTNTLVPLPTIAPAVTLAPDVTQPPAVPTAPPSAAVADKYSYIGQNPADETELPANHGFDMTWTVENTGTTTWTKNYSLVFFIGDRMAPAGRPNVYTLKNEVKPGERYDLVVDMLTPAAPGTYMSWWKLKNDQGQNFGDVTLTIKVGAAVAAPSLTPTTTATP